MLRLRDTSIRTKLSIGFGLSLILMLAIGAVSLVQVASLNAIAEQVTKDWLPEMEILSEMKLKAEEHRLIAMRRPNITNFRLLAQDSAKMRTLEAEVDENVRVYAAQVDDQQESELLSRFAGEWAAYRQSLVAGVAKLDAGDLDGAKQEFGTTTAEAYSRAASTIDRLVARERAEGLSVAGNVRAVYALSLGLIAAVFLIAVAGVSVAIRWISSSVTRPILEISHAMQRLSAGDNTVEEPAGAGRRDEIGVLAGAVSGYRESQNRVRQLANEANRERQRLDAALTNMSQGLCMFGPDERLVIFNPRFTEIFRLSAHQVRPGMTTSELMKLSAEFGHGAPVDPESTLAFQKNLIRSAKAGAIMQHLTDGRTVSISHRPMPDGGFVVTFEDVTQQLRAEEKIRHMAHYDALTDLPNRITFYERIEEILAHLRRSESIAVLSLDLDRFKNVNDMLGHPVGDRLLQSVANRMRSCVRDEDIVARLGGDEFAVVQVPSEDSADASALAARLIEVVGAPYELDSHHVAVGVSVGISVAPGDGKEPDVLMKNADLALYRAKADGGGTYRFFETEMDARMQARRLLELDLRKAIAAHEFEVYYQPIVDLKTGRITACEALIRWHHPERGMIPPLEFIPLAEETGLIVPLGEFVLRQACMEAVKWPEQVTVSVNLSPAQFKNRGLAQSVKEALAISGLPPHRLELEITELVLLQENDGAFSVLHQLRKLGIKIAMDDFGTGYSSLGYLRSFPFDKIKIDKSFIHDLPGKEDSVAIVRAVVGLSSSLGIITTAEGVETKEQLERLTSEGCNEVQGFLFSPPRPAKEVGQMLRELIPADEAVA